MILHHAIIDPAAEIGPGLYIPHPSGVIFRGTAGANLTLYSVVIVGPLRSLPYPGAGNQQCPNIGDDVSIGAFALILGPVTVGSRARVGARAVVTQDVAADAALVATHVLPRKIAASNDRTPHE
jgi:serine O-acetyltransferase